ncbi:MAG: radical SAM protein [Sulfolobaceae archaeon]|nr:radical SAM protein [Sulfolobaceae archaeon]
MELNSITYEDLEYPLYMIWQLTNRCNLECIHCLWASHEPYPDELSVDEVLKFGKELVDHQVLYVTLSGGEPLLHPAFWKLVELLRSHDVELKIETNGQLISKSVAKRLAELDFKAVQVSFDGASKETYEKMRVRGSYEKVIEAIKNLVEYGVNVEVVFVPTKFNIEETGKLIDLLASLGVRTLYTARPIYMGRAALNWSIVNPTEEQIAKYIEILEKKEKEYQGKMRIIYSKLSPAEELAYTLQHPTPAPIVTANGYIRLANSLPFVIGNVRKDDLKTLWERYKKAWRHPQVIDFINSAIKDYRLLAKSIEFIPLSIE